MALQLLYSSALNEASVKKTRWCCKTRLGIQRFLAGQPGYEAAAKTNSLHQISLLLSFSPCTQYWGLGHSWFPFWLKRGFVSKNSNLCLQSCPLLLQKIDCSIFSSQKCQISSSFQKPDVVLLHKAFTSYLCQCHLVTIWNSPVSVFSSPMAARPPGMPLWTNFRQGQILGCTKTFLHALHKK